MLVRIRSWNPCVLPFGMYNGIATMENSTVVPQEIKHGIAIWSVIALLEIHPNEWKVGTQIFVYLCSWRLNSQKWKQPNCPQTDEWINKMWLAKNRILFSLKGNSKICYNMDETWGHYAKGNKPVTKYTNTICAQVWFYYHKVLRKVIFIDRHRK